MRYYAQTLNVGGSEITGPLDPTKFNTIGDIVNTFLPVVFILALVAFFIYFVWAGFDLARALGSAEIIKKSKTRMTNALIGIFLLAISYWAAEIITKIFWG